jgi:hypothetical protein
MAMYFKMNKKIKIVLITRCITFVQKIFHDIHFNFEQIYI